MASVSSTKPHLIIQEKRWVSHDGFHFLSLVLTMRLPDTWVQRHFKARLHRYSAVMCFHHSEEEERLDTLSCWVCCSHSAEAVFGWVSVTGQLTASSPFIKSMAADFPWMASAVALEFWCPPGCHLEPRRELNSGWVYIFLSWVSISKRQGLLSLLIASSTHFLLVSDTPWVKYHLYIRPCHALSKTSDTIMVI